MSTESNRAGASAEDASRAVSVSSALQPHGKRVVVIGAGLAGSECAWILAEHYRIPVLLLEMKPSRMTPAQCMPHCFAELVCSNSLKSTSPLNPAGLLKTEISALGSLIVPSALASQVPAGEALAVDREAFSGSVTKSLRNHPLITIEDTLVTNLQSLRDNPENIKIVVATGPLTDGGLDQELAEIAQGLETPSSSSQNLYFYDAIAPILDGSTIDHDVAFFANREKKHERGQSTEDNEIGDYLNIPLSKDEYLAFVEKLVSGPKVPHHNFEEPRYFNGCQPIENLAESGPLTLAHGPMKGRGLTDPKTGRWPFAAVQLRRETVGHGSFNMVGFQTRLTWTAQREIFRTLPGLANVEFHRMGSMHRNTYLCAPALLSPDFSLRKAQDVHICGQIMGVEGYLESAAMGCLLGHILGHQIQYLQNLILPPTTTSLGCLARHVIASDPKNYTPMNIHWGLFDGLGENPVRTGQAHQRKMGKTERRQLLSERATLDFASWLAPLRKFLQTIPTNRDTSDICLETSESTIQTKSHGYQLNPST